MQDAFSVHLPKTVEAVKGIVRKGWFKKKQKHP